MRTQLAWAAAAIVPAALAAPQAIPVTTTVNVPITGVPVSSVSTLSDLPSTLTSSLAGCTNIQNSVTSNDIVNGVCRPVTLIFARGTSEGGNMGSIVGPPFVAALQARLGGNNSLAVQGVNNYAADVAGFNAGGSASGAANMAQLVNMTMAVCPSTKLCISGYSQGAQVVHLAANMFTADQTAFVNSAVLFGDPDNGDAVGAVPASKVSVDCHVLDDICLHGDIIDQSHLDYCLDAAREASFVASQAGY